MTAADDVPALPPVEAPAAPAPAGENGNTILTAAIGLTSLGTGSSPSSASPTPRDDNAANQQEHAAMGASTGEPARQPEEPVQRPGSEPMMLAMMTNFCDGPLASGPLKRQTSEPMACQFPNNMNMGGFDGNGSGANNPRWPSAMRPQMQTDLNALRLQALSAGNTGVLSDSAYRMAMASSDRMGGMMDRTAFLTSSFNNGGGFSGMGGLGGYSGMGGMGLPPLPTPHQITPVPNTKNFPESLFEFISGEEHADIISWLPHGRGFIIHDKQRFIGYILQRYFDGAKFTSFTRRLKRWGFVRVPRGPELGAYYNQYFVRDSPHLVKKMKYRTDGNFDRADDSEPVPEKSKEELQMEERIEEEVKRRVQLSLQSQKAAALPSAAGGSEEEKASAEENPKGSSGNLVSDASVTSHDLLTDMMEMQHSNAVTPNDPQDRRLTEMQRNLLLSQCMLPHDMAQRGYAQAEVVLAAKRKLEAECQRDMTAKILADREAMAATAGNSNGNGLVPPFVQENMEQQMGMGGMGYEGGPPASKRPKYGMDNREARIVSKAGGGRPVIMSQQEEEEFAEYLMMKRQNGGPMMR